ncbi:MAG: DUF4368 domain-containing protein, partial [Oscillospiraceae bacterium]|nr:DUF4368 domain-containing protein [Oscillospiraceae bacterium]
SEQKSKQQALTEQINQAESVVYNAKVFTNLSKKYINITELNARILNELIEKIVVHEIGIINSEKYQKVEIYYKFVGLLQNFQKKCYLLSIFVTYTIRECGK